MQHEGSRGFQFVHPILAAIGLTLAIASVLAPRQRTPLEAPAPRIVLPLPAWVVVAAVGSLSLASLIFLAITLPRGRGRRKKGQEESEIYHEPRKIPPWLTAVLILIALAPSALLGGAIFWLGGHGAYIADGSGGLASPHVAAMPSAVPPDATASIPGNPTSAITSGLLGTIMLLVGFGSLGFMLWLLFADRGMGRMRLDFDYPDLQLTALTEESLEDLRREPEARIAIMKIYRNFERVLAGVAVPRPPWQTSTEFMRLALGKLPLPVGPVGRLTQLFETARFSRHPVGEAERETAWRALTEIRARLVEATEARLAALS